jgi:hypothetical protein
MARRSTIEGDHYFAGSVSLASVSLPSNCLRNAQVAADAAIDASKVVHQFSESVELFAPTTTIASVEKLLKVVRGATGTVVAFEAVLVTKATAGDKTVTVDLQKSTGGGAFASILTAPISFSDASANLTALAATIGSAGLVAGDVLKIVVAAAGSTGTQALGLLVTLTQSETPA